MILPRQLAVRFSDLVLFGAFVDAEEMIIVLFS
jgi:hypothetical protein